MTDNAELRLSTYRGEKIAGTLRADINETQVEIFSTLHDCPQGEMKREGNRLLPAHKMNTGELYDIMGLRL